MTGARVLILTGLAALAVIGPAFAQEGGLPTFQTQAKFAILIDADSNAVLLQKRADDLMHPASMSKLMTMVMVFEAIRRGDLRLDENFFISENAWRSGGAVSGSSTMFAKVNSEVPLEDLIRGVIIQSGNDACIAIAEGMYGTEDAFAQAMTARGRELGLRKSTFMNATGWPDENHKMTARELAAVARHIIYDLPEFYHYYSEKEFTWNGITQKNRNPLLTMDIGVDGLKTGYVEQSGYGLVASAVRDGRRLLLVINGLESINDRATEARKLLDWGFRAYQQFVLFEPGEEVGTASVWGGEKGAVRLVTRKRATVSMQRMVRSDIKARIVYDGPLKAPVSEGAEVAKLRVEAPNHMPVDLPLYAAESVGEGGLTRKALDALGSLILGRVEGL
jgi:D-alanyl-D-alanine carboxypeptidase (penicillin-binding protein 5/6)